MASKAAVVALTEVLAMELPAGITINAVAPGAVPTTFMREVLDVGPALAGQELVDTVEHTAMPDLGDLRRLLLYLVGGDAGWLTGRCLSARWDDPAALSARA